MTPPAPKLSPFRMIWPFAQRTPCVFTVLTSALGPGVSPVVLLTVCAGLPSEAIAALALSSELNSEVTAKNNSHDFKKKKSISSCVNERERILSTFLRLYEMRQLPRYRKR